ncbi:MAG: alpha/beta fold hydrolase [Hyphomicrobiales bacterium]|nr:alpha/beta fold hydrolase [Hyphomicrobiales bacterium]MCP5371176.1 alpha/beta fold hydrolase [Hyphomicrobiales bacterium]
MDGDDFIEQGRGAAVVFIHGIGGGAACWTRQVDAFGRLCRAMAWNMPGYGGTALLPETTFAAVADRLAALLDARGIDRAHLVGHSLGGMVAQEFCARHGERLHTVTLCATSSAFGKSDGDFQRAFLADRLGPLDAGRTMADMAADLVPGLLGDDPDPAGTALALDCMARVPADTYRAMMRCLVTFDRRQALAAIPVPALVLAGGRDTTAPASMMERMAVRIPAADYVCLDGAGHMVNMERPGPFNAALAAFLGRHGLDAAGAVASV